MNFFETLSAHWHVIASLAVLAAGVAALYLATKFVRHERCKEHRESIDKAQADALAGLPTTTALHSLQLQMVALQGSMEALGRDIKAHDRALENVERLARSMDTYLREHGVKR